MEHDEQLKADLTKAFEDHFNRHQTRGLGATAGKINIQALIQAILQLIAAFTGGGNNPQPAPPTT